MYCVKCGKKIDDQCSFCTFCGAPVEKEKDKINEENTNEDNENIEEINITEEDIIEENSEENLEDTKGNENNDHSNNKDDENDKIQFNNEEQGDEGGNISTLNFIKDAIIHPFYSLKIQSKEISNKFAIIYFILIGAIASLISLIGFNSYFNKFMEFLGSLENINYSELYKSINELRIICYEMLPGSKIFLFNFIGIIMLYGIIALISYLIFTLIMKNKGNFLDYLKSLLVVMTIDCFMSIIILISSYIAFPLMTLILIIKNILIISLIFVAIVNISKENTTVIYTYPIIYLISKFLSIFISSKIIIHHIIVFMEQLL